MKEKRNKPRGFGPNLVVQRANLQAQKCPSFVWPLQFARRALTREYGEHPILAIGFCLQATWRLMGWRSWWSTLWALHLSTWRKNITKFWGTWDSNPGPNAHMPTLQPLQPNCLIVIEIRNKYYIKNKTLSLKINKNALMIWMDQ